MNRFTAFLRRLLRQEDGVAFVEFAMGLVLIVPMLMSGMELANYISAKMRVRQVALHVSDNASRIGIDSLLASPRITETLINDLLIGARLQAGTLDLTGRGRVILSSVEPDTVNSGKNMIRWQRCIGNFNWNSSFGSAGASNLGGVGPTGRQVNAPAGGGVMLVELAYNYRPILSSSIVPDVVITETAAMVVRDQRDYVGPSGGGIYNTEGATPASC